VRSHGGGGGAADAPRLKGNGAGRHAAGAAPPAVDHVRGVGHDSAAGEAGGERRLQGGGGQQRFLAGGVPVEQRKRVKGAAEAAAVAFVAAVGGGRRCHGGHHGGNDGKRRHGRAAAGTGACRKSGHGWVVGGKGELRAPKKTWRGGWRGAGKERGSNGTETVSTGSALVLCALGGATMAKENRCSSWVRFGRVCSWRARWPPPGDHAAAPNASWRNAVARDVTCTQNCQTPTPKPSTHQCSGCRIHARPCEWAAGIRKLTV